MAEAAEKEPPVITSLLDIPLENQSLELPDQPGVRCSHLIKDGQPIAYLQEDVRTLYDTFQQGKKASGDGPCLGLRKEGENEFEWITYSQVESRATNLGAGLSHIGIKTGDNANVGIFSQNSIEWVVCEQSCSYYSRVAVPLYDTLGAEALTHILNQAEITVVLCEGSKLDILYGQAEHCPALHHVIKMSGTTSDEEKEKAEKSGLKLYNMIEVEMLGDEHKTDLVLPKPESVATICYTSGTTGQPKGVILTHGNIIANMAGVYTAMGERNAPNANDSHISYLPLAHMLERVVHCIVFMCGARIGFYGGDIKLLVKDIQSLKPTMFVSVPRLLNRIYDKITAGTNQSSKIKKVLYNQAMKSKTKQLKRGLVRQDSFWDKLVLRKVRDLLGGNVRVIFTGSAPIAAHVLDFYRAGFGVQVFEGYGQTECTSACSTTLPHDVSAGHVGPPLVSALIKLVDVPDMNYFASDGEGEVCVKGPSVFQGYYKDEEKTREAIDDDGWLHSGDIGKWNDNGTLSITDRKKHIFKLSQGEYVAPEKVENIYCRSPMVAQAYLHGDSLQSMCVAIIVPDEEELMAWAQKQQITGTFDELCKNEAVIEAIRKELKKCAEQAGLKSFEQAKVIQLRSEQFSIENDLLTPTYKLRRPTFRRLFSDSVNEMYCSITVDQAQAARF